MRINLEADEHIIASLPKIWETEPGLMGFFTKSREGILVLTTKKIAFVPKFVYVTPAEREKYFGGDEAKVTRLDKYSEVQLDEDLGEQSKSSTVSLKSIVDVETVKLRNVNFLRITFRNQDGKIRRYDFGITKSVTNYPIRQPMLFYNLNWDSWVKMIKAYL
jgi:hypothetical protein